MSETSRRKWIGAGITAGGLAVAAKLADRYGLVPPDGSGIYGPGATLSYATHRLIGRGASAREFRREQISKTPYPNGRPPQDEIFKAEEAAGFSNWKVTVGGMVERPASYSLRDLKAMALRSQITQLSCEEGWSYIAEWTGVPLGLLLFHRSSSAPVALTSETERLLGWPGGGAALGSCRAGTSARV